MAGHDLFDRLRALNLPSGDFAVFGSGTLAIRGLIDDPADLDILCRGVVWQRISEIGELQQLEDGTFIASLDNGLLTFGRTWAIGSVDIDEMIDTAEVIDGLPFVRLEHVVDYKRLRQTDRDREHLALMEEAGFL